MTERIETRLMAAPLGDLQLSQLAASEDTLLFARVVQQLGSSAPAWTHVLVRRAGGDRPTIARSEDDIVVLGELMELPAGPVADDPSWDTVLFHICRLPDPDLVGDWMRTSREITAGMPLAPLAWIELDDASNESWGEVHLTSIRDDAAVADLIEDPRWVAAQPLLERTVAPHHQLVTKPILNRLGSLET